MDLEVPFATVVERGMRIYPDQLRDEAVLGICLENKGLLRDETGMRRVVPVQHKLTPHFRHVIDEYEGGTRLLPYEVKRDGEEHDRKILERHKQFSDLVGREMEVFTYKFNGGSQKEHLLLGTINVGTIPVTGYNPLTDDRAAIHDLIIRGAESSTTNAGRRKFDFLATEIVDTHVMSPETFSAALAFTKRNPHSLIAFDTAADSQLMFSITRKNTPLSLRVVTYMMDGKFYKNGVPYHAIQSYVGYRDTIVGFVQKSRMPKPS